MSAKSRAPSVVFILIISGLILCTLQRASAEVEPVGQKEARQRAFDALDAPNFFKNARSSSVDCLMQGGQINLYMCSPAVAASYFDQALKQAPKNPDLLTWRAYCHLNAGENQKAIGQANEALAINPKAATALAVRGRAYFRMGRTSEGTSELENAITIDPKNFAAHELLAKCYQDQLQDKQALEELGKLTQFYPRAIRPYLLRANLLAKSAANSEAALRDYAVAIKNGPRCYMGYLDRGNTLYKLSRWNEAIPDFIKVPPLDTFGTPTGISRRHLIECYEHTNQYAKAIAVHDLGGTLDQLSKKKHLDGWELSGVHDRAVCYLGLKQYGNALAAVALIEKYKPNSAETLQLKAKIYQTMGDHKKALAEFQKLMSLDKAIPEWYRARAESYQALGQKGDAERDLAKAKELEGDF